MEDPISLTVEQQFEMARFCRAIENTGDVETLRKIAKQLLLAWMNQKAACVWVMKNGKPLPAAEAEAPPPWDDPLA